MSSVTPTARRRQLAEIAEALPQRASALTRLFLGHAGGEVSRTEAGVLRALATQPRRITELATREGVTQPAVTWIVNRLHERGWVERGADPDDGRVVLVTLTPLGRQAFDGLRARYQALLHEPMATLPDEDVATLARAVEILDGVIVKLKEGAA